MAGNILYGIRYYGTAGIKIVGKTVITIITIMQMLLAIINILFLICEVVLKMFLAVMLIGHRK